MTKSTSSRHPHPHELAASLPRTLPTARIRYAEDSPIQFADLRIPKTEAGPAGHPVIIFIHGGGWLADWSKDYSAPFVEALTDFGFATWDLEFRRIGNSAGGYPEIFRDVAKATDHLRHISASYALDLDRVIAMGHSSGGHLALWLAGRVGLPADSPLYSAEPLDLKGVISIGGVNDLEHSLQHGGRTDILRLLGCDSPSVAEDLFAHTSPARLLPFGVPQVLVLGTQEDVWRKEMTHAYAEAAMQLGDDIELIEPEGADHFDVVHPLDPTLVQIAQAAGRLLKVSLHGSDPA